MKHYRLLKWSVIHLCVTIRFAVIAWVVMNGIPPSIRALGAVVKKLVE